VFHCSSPFYGLLLFDVLFAMYLIYECIALIYVKNRDYSNRMATISGELPVRMGGPQVPTPLVV
jgi:hypothetical protein